MMRNLTTAAEGLKKLKKEKRKNKKIEINAYRSKWLAAIEKGMQITPGEKDNILYLGASSGTTVKYIAGLTRGIVFAVENSVDMAIPLVRLAEKSKNIAPIFCSARDIEKIKKALYGTKIDILFQDIPSIDQVEILIRASSLVDKNAKILFSLKTQSISQKNPEIIKKEIEDKLRKNFEILCVKSLEPYQLKHYFFCLRKKEK